MGTAGKDTFNKQKAKAAAKGLAPETCFLKQI